MLAMADANGVVGASVGGLARAANVTIEQCRKALDSFLGPDPDSRDGTTGERIEKVPGGWFVINHANYRDKQTREQELAAARTRKWRERKAAVTSDDVTERDVTERNGHPASASASVSASGLASAEGESAERGKPKPDLMRGFAEFYDAYGRKVKKVRAEEAWRRMKCYLIAEEVIAAAKVVAENVEEQFRRYPDKWLKDRGWLDSPPTRSSNRGSPRPSEGHGYIGVVPKVIPPGYYDDGLDENGDPIPSKERT